MAKKNCLPSPTECSLSHSMNEPLFLLPSRNVFFTNEPKKTEEKITKLSSKSMNECIFRNCTGLSLQFQQTFRIVLYCWCLRCRYNWAVNIHWQCQQTLLNSHLYAFRRSTPLVLYNSATEHTKHSGCNIPMIIDGRHNVVRYVFDVTVKNGPNIVHIINHATVKV